jgi:ATP-dependent RNA helicase RhlE
MPQEITKLADAMLRDPARVAVTPQATTVERIAQRVIHTDKVAKQSLLAELLKSETTDRVLVFTRTKHGADKVVRGLQKAGFTAEAIHGNKSQNQRERVLGAFRAGKLKTLVATDIAARGIDVTGISHVINYDLPNIPESYVHRIGRTARAGAAGVATSFCDHEERAYLRDIEKLIQMTIPSTDRRSAGSKQDRQPAKHHRPQQTRGGQHQRRGGDQQNRGGEQQRRGHRHPPRFGKQPHRNDGGRREQPRQADPVPSTSEIGQVAFMRHAPRQAQVAGDANRGTR